MAVRRLTHHVRTKIRQHTERLRFEDRRGWSAEWKLVGYGRLAVPSLLQVLSTGCPVSRYRAAYALGKIGDRSTVDPLVRVALSDVDERVRYDAIIALRDIGDDRAASALREILVSERAVETGERGAAVEALRRCSPNDVPVEYTTSDEEQ